MAGASLSPVIGVILLAVSASPGGHVGEDVSVAASPGVR